MVNRFEEKFSNKAKEILVTGINVTEENLIPTEMQAVPTQIDSENALEGLNIRTRNKKVTKSYYLSADLIKTVDKVAKNNNISASELLEHILKKAFKLND